MTHGRHVGSEGRSAESALRACATPCSPSGNLPYRAEMLLPHFCRDSTLRLPLLSPRFLDPPTSVTMPGRMSENQEQATLLARAPLIFFWAEQLKAARDAIDAFYDENGHDLLGLSFWATPTFWELRERVKWCVAYVESLGNALHSL